MLLICGKVVHGITVIMNGGDNDDDDDDGDGDLYVT